MMKMDTPDDCDPDDDNDGALDENDTDDNNEFECSFDDAITVMIVHLEPIIYLMMVMTMMVMVFAIMVTQMMIMMALTR